MTAGFSCVAMTVSSPSPLNLPNAAIAIEPGGPVDDRIWATAHSRRVPAEEVSCLELPARTTLPLPAIAIAYALSSRLVSRMSTVAIPSELKLVSRAPDVV